MKRAQQRLESIKGKKRISPRDQAQMEKIRNSLDRSYETYKKGRGTENRFLHIVRNRIFDWPAWIIRVEDVSRYLDEKKGVDVLVTTSKGPIGLQIKSSDLFATQHYKKHPKIPLFVVSPEVNDDDIYKMFISIVSIEMANGRFFTTTHENS